MSMISSEKIIEILQKALGYENIKVVNSTLIKVRPLWIEPPEKCHGTFGF